MGIVLVLYAAMIHVIFVEVCIHSSAFDPAYLIKMLFIRCDVENAIFFAYQIALRIEFFYHILLTNSRPLSQHFKGYQILLLRSYTEGYWCLSLNTILTTSWKLMYKYEHGFTVSSWLFTVALCLCKLIEDVELTARVSLIVSFSIGVAVVYSWRLPLVSIKSTVSKCAWKLPSNWIVSIVSCFKIAYNWFGAKVPFRLKCWNCNTNHLLDISNNKR